MINTPDHTIIDLKFDYKLIHKNGDQRDFGQFDIAISSKDGRLHVIECKTHKYDNKDLLANLKKVRDIGGIYTNYLCVIPWHPDDFDEGFVKYKVYQNVVQTMSVQNVATYYLSLDIEETPILQYESIDSNTKLKIKPLRTFLHQFIQKADDTTM